MFPFCDHHLLLVDHSTLMSCSFNSQIIYVLAVPERKVFYVLLVTSKKRKCSTMSSSKTFMPNMIECMAFWRRLAFMIWVLCWSDGYANCQRHCSPMIWYICSIKQQVSESNHSACLRWFSICNIFLFFIFFKYLNWF